MIEAVATNVTNVPAVEKVAPTEALKPVKAEDIHQFDRAMEAGNTSDIHINRVESTDAIKMQPIETENNRLGDRVLDGVERLRTESKQHMEDIMVSLSDPNLSSSDLMKVTFDMNLWSLKQDLLAKSAGGIDRSVDNLLKAQ